MSVSLCVIRIETADDCPVPTYLEYAGVPKLARSMSSESSSQTDRHGNVSSGEAASLADAANSGSKPPGAEANAFKEVNRRHRGRREFHEIVIESHSQLDSSVPESPHKSKEPSPSLLELNSGEKKPRPSSQINFFSGNPFVEITKGILHLFKENHMTKLTGDVPRSEMLCILAVPASMTSHDLLQFMAPCSDNITHVRIIRDATPNQYMVLLKFRMQDFADEFYETYNGTQFNSIEPEACHLVYISRVETSKDFNIGSLALDGHTELPTCPVCLERMDESVDGILTVLCNHSFHGNCLDKWGDSSCPVCRYCQTPEVAADNRCSECHKHESLWICLICGHVGCGRYVEGHAYNHYLDTQHTYAMQLGNNRVWDYAGDNYVHRLIQNKGDGKLVAFNEQSSVVEQDEKLDSMQLECTYLLTSQLESQRLYFEDKVMKIEKEAHRQISDLKECTKQMSDEFRVMKQKLESVTKEKASVERKVQQLTGKLNKASKDLSEEKQINECLRENQEVWQSRVKELEASTKKNKDEKDSEIHELKEQLRDVMFYLEAQQTLQNAPEATRQEIQDGQITIGSAKPTAGSSGAQNQRRKKK